MRYVGETVGWLIQEKKKKHYFQETHGAGKAVFHCVGGHNPGQVATPPQDVQMAHCLQSAGTDFANLNWMTG